MRALFMAIALALMSCHTAQAYQRQNAPGHPSRFAANVRPGFFGQHRMDVARRREYGWHPLGRVSLSWHPFGRLRFFPGT